jgi:guanosine-3',5'-bis(diphosphate) 3'-pyrophosphohydrolase
MNETNLIFKALHFAAKKHRHQRRKDEQALPYINHPIQVAETLTSIGNINDSITLCGALLHDVLEDTNTSTEELQAVFGKEICDVVQEVSDDKNLSKIERKRMQIEFAPHASIQAKHIKLADKICNVYDIIHHPPEKWSIKRKLVYVEWSKQVIDGLRGCNQSLETAYDEIYLKAKNIKI